MDDALVVTYLQDLIERGYVVKIGENSYAVTACGNIELKTCYPRSYKRASLGAITVRELISSCEEERKERQVNG